MAPPGALSGAVAVAGDTHTHTGWLEADRWTGGSAGRRVGESACRRVGGSAGRRIGESAPISIHPDDCASIERPVSGREATT